MEQESIKEVVKILSDPTSKDRTNCYSTLACCLKAVSSNAPIPEDVFNHRKKLIESILSDISKDDPVSPFAIQALGYILFNELVARCLDGDVATSILEALLKVINSGKSTKTMCTRALWCLANQNLDSSVILPHIPQIGATLKNITSSPYLQNSSVTCEALNVLQKLLSQCKSELMKISVVWYSLLVYTLLSKHAKVQQKALQLADDVENSLESNSELSNWLYKELKTNLLPYINSLLSSKGIDQASLMRVWMHFIVILGKTLHKSGSFLNELLKVVEAGFKNRAMLVQIAAYRAWMVLIDDFALDINVFTNPKRLKLLLMPLVGSAVKQKFFEVDEARVGTWWHLICKLIPLSNPTNICMIFHDVCIPFLLFCLGLDPKSDMSAFVPQKTSNLFDTSLNPKKIFTLLSSTVTPKPIGTASHYPSTPHTSVISNGCLAILLFLGIENVDVKEATCVRASSSIRIFENNKIPLNFLPFFLLYVEGTLHYESLLPLSLVESVGYNILRSAIFTLSDPTSSHTPMKESILFSIFELILQMKDIMKQHHILDILCQTSNLPSKLFYSLRTSTRVEVTEMFSYLLERTLYLLIGGSCNLQDQQKSQLLSLCGRIITVITMKVGVSKVNTKKQLDAFCFVIKTIECNLSEHESEHTTMSEVWCKLGERFTEFLKETSQECTFIDPDFVTVKQILKFPFQHGFAKGDQKSSSVFNVWKKLYYVTRIHVGLLVKDTNFSVQMVSEDLLCSLKQFMSNATSEAPISSATVFELDNYLNCLTSVTCIIVEGLSTSGQWSRSGSSVLSSLTSISQLISLCITEINTLITTHCAKLSINITVLTSPHSAYDVTHKLYNMLPQNEAITIATDVLCEPVARLMKITLSGSSPVRDPVSKKIEKSPSILDDAVTTWKMICRCYQSRYSDTFSSELLKSFAPLLEVMLLSKREVLVKETIQFWCNTFGKATELIYPLCLQSALTKFLLRYKMYSDIPLPGFVPLKEPISISSNDDDDDIEQITEDSEPMAVLPSPVPLRLSHSPAISNQRKDVGVNGNARQKLSLDSKDNEEYVMIPPAVKKSKLLTEHQKEKMRERSDSIPSLYNTVDPSLSTQPFTIDESQQQGLEPQVIGESVPTEDNTYQVDDMPSNSSQSILCDTTNVTQSSLNSTTLPVSSMQTQSSVTLIPSVTSLSANLSETINRSEPVQVSKTPPNVTGLQSVVANSIIDATKAKSSNVQQSSSDMIGLSLSTTASTANIMVGNHSMTTDVSTTPANIPFTSNILTTTTSHQLPSNVPSTVMFKVPPAVPFGSTSLPGVSTCISNVSGSDASTTTSSSNNVSAVSLNTLKSVLPGSQDSTSNATDDHIPPPTRVVSEITTTSDTSSSDPPMVGKNPKRRKRQTSLKREKPKKKKAESENEKSIVNDTPTDNTSQELAKSKPTVSKGRGRQKKIPKSQNGKVTNTPSSETVIPKSVDSAKPTGKKRGRTKPKKPDLSDDGISSVCDDTNDTVSPMDEPKMKKRKTGLESDEECFPTNQTKNMEVVKLKPQTPGISSDNVVSQLVKPGIYYRSSTVAPIQVHVPSGVLLTQAQIEAAISAHLLATQSLAPPKSGSIPNTCALTTSLSTRQHSTEVKFNEPLLNVFANKQPLQSLAHNPNELTSFIHSQIQQLCVKNQLVSNGSNTYTNTSSISSTCSTSMASSSTNTSSISSICSTSIAPFSQSYDSQSTPTTLSKNSNTSISSTQTTYSNNVIASVVTTKVTGNIGSGSSSNVAENVQKLQQFLDDFKSSSQTVSASQSVSTVSDVAMTDSTVNKNQLPKEPVLNSQLAIVSENALPSQVLVTNSIRTSSESMSSVTQDSLVSTVSSTPTISSVIPLCTGKTIDSATTSITMVSKLSESHINTVPVTRPITNIQPITDVSLDTPVASKISVVEKTYVQDSKSQTSSKIMSSAENTSDTHLDIVLPVAKERMESNVKSQDDDLCTAVETSRKEATIMPDKSSSTEDEDVSKTVKETIELNQQTVEEMHVKETLKTTEKMEEDVLAIKPTNGSSNPDFNTEHNICDDGLINALSSRSNDMEICLSAISVPSLSHLASVVVTQYEEEDKLPMAELPHLKPLPSTSNNSSIQISEPRISGSLPCTPTNNDQQNDSPKLTPIGILKHASQFDTPLSVAKGRRVQFTIPVVMGKQEAPVSAFEGEETKETKRGRYARSRRKSPFSSRRTLQLTGISNRTTPDVLFSNTSSASTTGPPQKQNDSPSSPPQSGAVFPSLKSCDSSVEQILPALSPSGKFTHGLYNLIHARNITTIGNLSALTENEILTLPIKSPKVTVLRNALRNFETKMTQGQKRKMSKDEANADLPAQKYVRHEPSYDETESERQGNEDMDVVTLSTPDSQLHVVEDNQSLIDNKKVEVETLSTDKVESNHLDKKEANTSEQLMDDKLPKDESVTDKHNELDDPDSYQTNDKSLNVSDAISNQMDITTPMEHEEVTREYNNKMETLIDQSNPSYLVYHDHTYDSQSPVSPTSLVQSKTSTSYNALDTPGTDESEDLFSGLISNDRIEESDSTVIYDEIDCHVDISDKQQTESSDAHDDCLHPPVKQTIDLTVKSDQHIDNADDQCNKVVSDDSTTNFISLKQLSEQISLLSLPTTMDESDENELKELVKCCSHFIAAYHDNRL